MNIRGALAALLAAATLAGCAAPGAASPEGAGDRAAAPANPVDPLEPLNRAIFDFNDAVDSMLVKPIGRAYADVVPELYRNMIGNVFSNIGDLWIAANQLLQGKPALALSDLARVAINSTIGFAGVADAATSFGFERHNEDFGQTLGVWGVVPGPYVVLPILGPSNLRDTVGWVFDIFADPLSEVYPVDARNSAYGVRFVDRRASYFPAEKVMEGAVLDKYSFLRDAYLQRRRSLVYDGNPPEPEDDEDQQDDDAGATPGTPGADAPK